MTTTSWSVHAHNGPVIFALFAQAEQSFRLALAIRVELNLPRQDSTRRALAYLAELRS